MTYASVTDVAARLDRELTTAERNLAAVLLDDVEEEIRTRIRDLDTRIATGRLSRKIVVRVEAAAVLRVLRNPNAMRTETAGDYSYTLDTRAASGFLSIVDSEWRLLGVSPGAFTIAPAFPPPLCPARHGRCWCPVRCR